MTIAVGDKLPDVKIVKATADANEAVQSADYFKGKKVALFSVPGAFTPTCSAKHLPGFVDKAADLKAKGHQVSNSAQSSGVATIMRVTKNGKPMLQGGADPRREGIVLGDGAL